MNNVRKRHCWECLRRKLVCDFAHPACKRCVASGTNCPGYDTRQPLRLKWLPPGKVNSRSRERKGPISSNLRHSESHRTPTGCSVACSVAGTADVLGDVRLPSIEIPTDYSAVFQAAQYFNRCIYHDLLPLLDLGPNPHVYRISQSLVQLAIELPDFLRCLTICMALSHHVNRMTLASSSTAVPALNEKFYQYRGSAIRSLNLFLNVDHQITGDFVIAGIISLLLVDAQHNASDSWQHHIYGLQKLIALRGGIKTLAASRDLEPLLISFTVIGVLGNTTTAASDLIMAENHAAEFTALIGRHSDDIPVFQMCPPLLYLEIININHLRRSAVTSSTLTPEAFAVEAGDILERVHQFDAFQWAGAKASSQNDWTLLGNISQAAVALYCILSLQSLAVLPIELQILSSLRATHVETLQRLIAKAMASLLTKRFMVWPLVVLGVEAVRHGPSMRGFVEQQLQELSRYTGTYVPLNARNMLQRFWASGETRWDACFDRPYTFTTQIAVDVSRIMHSLHRKA